MISNKVSATKKRFFIRAFVILSIVFGPTVTCTSPEFRTVPNSDKRFNAVIRDPFISLRISKLSTLTETNSDKAERREDIETEKRSIEKWMKLNLSNLLRDRNVAVDPSRPADYYIYAEIKDLGEIRNSVVVWSIVTGIATGLLLAVVTGHSELGAGFFLYEIVEESLYPIVALALLREYLCFATVEYIVEDSQGRIVFQETFNSFSNDGFLEKNGIPKEKRRDMVVRASLDETDREFVSAFIKSVKAK
ncbi:hypothetical protein EHO60_01520 [Leptospira fletcheri]|uniref:Uncharacterized protein n=1 Tax=Leptospira fletcheri TaxID=2484981 RepID=A0A4R9GKD3_9LEPT|nr:hypothetical protein [Leptospira fletcheri]TGK14049.1 hypothetical protein EHO60_01520 [Leptospira fletcheri]